MSPRDVATSRFIQFLCEPNRKAPGGNEDIITAIMDAGDDLLRSLRSNAQTQVVIVTHALPIFM
jgi:hypothetical protein